MKYLKISLLFASALLLIIPNIHARSRSADSIFVCGVNKSGEVYIYENGEWQSHPENILKKITVNNKGVIWGADFMGTLWRQAFGYGWYIYPAKKKVSDVSHVNDLIWIIDDSSNTYFFNSKTAKWYPAGIQLSEIDVGSNSNVAGIGLDGKLYKSDYLTTQYLNGPFEEIPFDQKFIDAAVGDMIYAVTESGELYFYLGTSKEESGQKHEWLKINSEPLKRIDIDITGTIWAVTQEGRVMSYSKNTWNEYDIELADIAVSGMILK